MQGVHTDERDSQEKGSWAHRFLVKLFTVVLTVLTFWLLGFLTDDIGNWTGPEYSEIEQRMLDPQVVDKSRSLESRIAESQRQITSTQGLQTILRDSTQSSQETMKQLLEIQRLGLQKNVMPTAGEQKALAESETLFLANQQRYQALHEEIARFNETLRSLEAERRGVEQTLEVARVDVRREFEIVRQRFDLRMALLKLAALSPLLGIAGWLFMRYRSGIYAPLVYAFGIAVMLKVALVMHEYFPALYFKYVLILVFLAATLQALTSLLRMIAHPKSDWLLKQYREAYESFFCPVCDFPIRRGPLKYLSWTRRTVHRLIIPNLVATEPEQPYTCPNCGTRLFEECAACRAIRHSLLPACLKCGDVRAISDTSTS